MYMIGQCDTPPK